MRSAHDRRVAPAAALLLCASLAPLLCAFVALPGGAGASTAPADGLPPDGTGPAADLAVLAKEIQNSCFALYPPELLARMAIDGGTPSAEVRNDPALQQKYLKAEDVVDKGLFYPARLEEVLPGLRALARDGVRFLDLGSGDGRVVFLAALTGARATGIEYDRTLHRLARRCRKKLAEVLPLERIDLRRGDFFKEDWSRYDVIFYYVDGSFNQSGIQNKLVGELRDDALLLLYHPQEPFPGMEEVAAYGDVHVFRRAP